MIFCEKCFKLEEIRQIIKSANGEVKECEIDSNHGLSTTFDTVSDKVTLNDIGNIITPILELYRPQSELPKDFARKKIGDLKHSLFEFWPIFNISPDYIQEFLDELAEGNEDFRHELLTGAVGIQQVEEN